jgi:hypothetical protein
MIGLSRIHGNDTGICNDTPVTDAGPSRCPLWNGRLTEKGGAPPVNAVFADELPPLERRLPRPTRIFFFFYGRKTLEGVSAINVTWSSNRVSPGGRQIRYGQLYYRGLWSFGEDSREKALLVGCSGQ